MSENRKNPSGLSGDADLPTIEEHLDDLSGGKPDSLGLHVLDQKTIDNVLDEYLDLLDSSAAVFEQNGDYAGSRVSSGWCRLLNDTSRESCGTNDEQVAMKSGKWHCHESCWSASKLSMKRGQAADIGCLGGIRIHAVPVFAKGRIIGSINFGYSDPPRELKQLKVISKRYGIKVKELEAAAQSYEPRPPYLVDIFKKCLKIAAKLLGVMSERESLLVGLENRNERLERFAYTVTHDLKGPLLTIRGFLALLEKDLDSGEREKVKEDIDTISKAAEKMDRLIQNLLEISRIGVQSDRFKAISLVDIAQGALVNVKGRINTMNIKIDISPELPLVYANQERIQSVLENLIDNAAKFMGDQLTPLIEIGVRNGEKEKIITVRDNGIGIDPGGLESVFDIFKQLDPEKEGSGVGLAIVREIIEKHQGRCWMESKGESYGSTFCFTLPERHENDN